MITPADIHNKEFETGFRGYNKEDVDTFMGELVREYEDLFRENRELKDKIENLEKRLVQYESMEATMNSTLVLAQETGENVKAAARKEASLIIEDAECKSRNLVAEAEQSLRDAHTRYNTIRNEVSVFRAKMQSILQSQLALCDDLDLGESSVSVNDIPVAQTAPKADSGAKEDTVTFSGTDYVDEPTTIIPVVTEETVVTERED